jgi:hypothetical protein
MGDDHAPGGERRRHACEFPRDPRIGQPVEAIAANAPVIHCARQGETLGLVGPSAMECRVERRDLRHVGRQLGHGPDRGEVVWLVQRGERRKALQLGQHILVDADRCCELATAVNDAMADPDDFMSLEVIDGPVDQLGQQFLVAQPGAVGPAAIDGQRAVVGLCRQMGRGSDALDLAPAA